MPPADEHPPRVAPPPRILWIAAAAGRDDVPCSALESDYRLERVSDPREALAAARREAPDLVLVAATRPPEEGVRLVAALRVDLPAHRTPVLLLSAPEEAEFRIAGLEAGADGCLVTPLGTRELRVRVALELRRRARSQSNEEALRARDTRLRALVTWSRDGIVLVDSQGTILEWNEGEERITGVPRDAAVGQPIWEILHQLAPAESRTPEHLRVAREKVLAGLREGLGLARTLEDEIQRADGTRRIVQSELFALHEGAELFAAGISRDVTEQRRLEGELRKRQALMLEVERLVHVGYWERDLRTNRSFWTDETFRTLGYQPGSVPPGPDALLAAIAPQDRARIAESLTATLRDGATRRGEFEAVTPEGLRHVRATVELLQGDSGAPERLIGTIQDITEQKRVEQALCEADRRKDEFLATLSHELRAPLNTLIMAAANLEEVAAEDPRVAKLSGSISRAVASQSRLIEDLLDVSRIVADKLRLDLGPVELTEVVRDAVEETRSAVETKGVSLEIDLAPGVRLAGGDETRLRQVVQNLIENARKFTPPGGRVTVRLGTRDGHAELMVADTGIGIPPEVLPRLFSRFMQADGSGHTHGGLGLGLSIVRHLVEAHGGRVQAESAGQGQGATFRVTLPLQATWAGP